MKNNNNAIISGFIHGKFTYSHTKNEKKFYRTYIKSHRLSGYIDIIPIIVSENLVDISKDYTDKFVEISGEFCSCDKKDGDKNRLILYVYTKKIRILEKNFEEIHENQILIDGHICKKPIYRVTPRGREITDIIVAVNYLNNKADYIPCIVWRENARYIKELSIGSKVSLKGRIQSREYIKYFEDGTQEKRIAYEVSASQIEVLRKREDSE